MADKTITLIAADGTPIPFLAHDNGGGTWSLVSYGGGGTLPTGAATEATLAAQSAKLPAALSASGGLKTETAANRNGGILHRSVVAAVDKVSVPGTLTNSAITEAGSTLANVAYYTAVSAGNAWGRTGPGTLPATITPTANQAVRIAFAQVTGATYYDIFLSTDVSAPKGVGRITEAQRATGDQIISTVGVVSARAGSTVAGTIDVGIPGTGLQCTVAPFLSNNAYTPATPTPIVCTGYSLAHLHVKVADTSSLTIPILSIIPFFQDQTSTSDWFQGAIQSVALGTATGASNEQDFRINVDGATNMVILIDGISGSGTTATVWVELS